MSNLHIKVYNISMTPRHFAAYAKRDPKQYQAFSDSMWNSFVTVTHAIGLSPFFSFTPEFLQAKEVEQSNGRFAPGEIPGDQDQTP
jgi:hypothetical protein